MSSLFKLNIIDGRVIAEQTIQDKDGKDKALTGEPARIDADVYEAIGQAAIVVARSVGEHDDAVRLHRDAAGHDSKTLAALMLGLRAATKLAHGEIDWEAKSAAVQAGVAHLMELSIADYLATELAEARGPGGTGEMQHDIIVARRKRRDSLYSAANSALAKTFRDGLGVTLEGVAGERAKAVVAQFEKDGPYAKMYPPAALKVLKSGLPDAFWTKAAEREGTDNGYKLRLKSPNAVADAKKAKDDAAKNRKAILDVTNHADPTFVAEAIQAASVRVPVDVTADNAQTVIQGWFANLRILAGQIQSASHQFEGIENSDMSVGTLAMGAKILTDSASVLRTIEREAGTLAQSASMLGDELQDRHMKALAAKLADNDEPETPDSDGGEPDGSETAPSEPESKPEAATVTPIKRAARKPRTARKAPARSK